MYNENGNWSKEEYILTRNVSMVNEVARNNVMLKNPMSLWEYRIFYTAISLVEWDDDEFCEFTIPIKTLYNMFSPNTNYHVPTKELIAMTDELTGQTFVFYQEMYKNTRTVYSLFEFIRVIFDDNENVKAITFKLSKHLLPFVTELRNKQYVSMKLGYMMQFKAKYSFILYPVLSSVAKMGKYKVSVEKLMTMCSFTGRFSNFNKNILIPSIREINEKTNLAIIVNPIKNGKSTAFIEFTISEKKGKDLLEVNLWQPEDYFEKKL